jgi:hypothetical protein
MTKTLKFFMKIFLFNLLNLLLVISISKADIAKIANEIISQIKFEAIIAVQPIDTKASKISISSSKSLVDKLTNAIQISSQSNEFNLTLVERSKLDAVMLEQEEFQDVSEFSDLVSNLGAEILISPSVNRINDKEVEISARAIGVVGDNAGTVLSASNTYKIELPARYVFVVNSLTSGDQDRLSYVSSLNSGLSNFSEVLVKDLNDINEADYIIDLQFSLNVSEKETAESKEVKAQSEGNQMASEMFGSIMGGKGKENPFGDILKKSSEQNKKKAESLKKKIFAVDATGNMKNVSNGSMITENFFLEDSLGMDSSKDEQKIVVKRLVSQVLEEVGKQLAGKALGKKVNKESATSSLLD